MAKKQIQRKPKKTASKKTAKKRSKIQGLLPFPMVAIGASAGGVEASRELLKSIPDDLGMAYVFVHHLSATKESHLPEILQRETTMTVRKVTNRLKVEPNNVYVIPANTFMSIEDGHLITRVRTKSDIHAIDHFMESLAIVYQHNAIGILLSGTASDGTSGLKAIKLEGGITFAQDETAKHSEMPAHAQDAGYVDYVLPPHRIAEELAALIQHPYAVASPAEELSRNEKDFKKILSIVLQKFDVDFFSHYKRTTVNRRIMRRMALNKIESFSEYSKILRIDQNELNLLYNDFLINVTSFFREPNFFQALKKNVFPQLIKDRKATDPIRIWIPGCATGEEAYSTAIAITEFLEDKKIAIPVQLFSTDLDEKAITKARIGIYSKNSMSQVSQPRIKAYFTKIDGHYQIAKQIRDMCTFSIHNLMKDPPFSRIDLVSCQNVLIYIEAAPQRKILQAFHYALKPTGFLLLGKSESIGNASDTFQPLEKDSRLYRKKLQAVLPRLDFSVRTHHTTPSFQPFSEHRTESDVEREFDKVLLSRYVPASILINKDFEILRFRGQTSPYIQPPSGKATFNLLKMVKEELLFEVRGLLQKVKRTSLPSLKNGIAIDSENLTASIEIVPIKSSKELYYLLIFRPDSEPAPGQKQNRNKKDTPGNAAKLEQQLKDAREQVRTITEDFDVSREELQSANEEILSANEELQSINEELETSKEELQSANEELTTINEELQSRIDELKQSRDFVHAIIETIHGPMVVLNGQMRVRTANKAFYEFFKLKPDESEGQYISDLGNGQWDIPALNSHLQQIFPKKIQFKDLELEHNFPVIGRRNMVVNAYRLVYGKESKETQILLVFQDITQFRQAERALAEAEEQLRLALTGGQVGTWSWNILTNEVTGSREEALLFGLKGERFFSTYDQWLNALHPEDKVETVKQVRSSIANNTPLDTEFRIVTPDQDVRWILSKANVYFDKSNKPHRMMGVNIDITERKRAIEAIAESEKRFHMLSDHAPVMIWMSDANENCNYVNQTWLSFTGKTIEEEIGKGWYKGIHPDDLEGFLEIYDDAYANRAPFKTDYRLKRHDGEYRWIMSHGVPRFVANQTFSGFIGTSIDITERINLERQKDDFMSIASHELKTPVTSIKAYTQILHEKFKKMQDENTSMMLGRLDKQVDKMTELINTLLDVARIQSGQMEYDREEVDVNPFIKAIAEEMQRVYPSHEIALELSEDDTLITDKLRVTQVLNNLISNAIKYSPDANKIIIRTNGDENNFTFTVEDFGIGIPASKHEQIFERFFRVSEGEGNRASGLGLGLYITAQIVKQQGGKIWLTSEPDKGSSFSFSLPRNPETIR